MEIIELERWKPAKDDPRKLEYAGQPTAQEVFGELKYRLESMGCLPDEYFLLSSGWENGREIPRGADVFCMVDYGASEGVYKEIIRQCGNEKTAAAPPHLLELFAAEPDFRTLSMLVEKGIFGGGSAAGTLHMLTCGGGTAGWRRAS